MVIPDELLEPVKWVIGALAGALGWKGYLRFRTDRRVEQEASLDHKVREDTIAMLRTQLAMAIKERDEFADKLDVAVSKRWGAEAKVNDLTAKIQDLEFRLREAERDRDSYKQTLSGFYNRSE